jgi:hypothetical protein
MGMFSSLVLAKRACGDSSNQWMFSEDGDCVAYRADEWGDSDDPSGEHDVALLRFTSTIHCFWINRRLWHPLGSTNPFGEPPKPYDNA